MKGRARTPAGARARETQGAEEADTPQGPPLPRGLLHSGLPGVEPLCLFPSTCTSPLMAWGCPWGSVCPPSSASPLSSKEMTVYCSHSPGAVPSIARVPPPSRCSSRKSQAEPGIPSPLLLTQVCWIPPLATQTLGQ